MASSWQRLEELWHEAVELAPEDRAAYVEEVCSLDPDLGRRLVRLLEADGTAGDFLGGAGLAEDPPRPPGSLRRVGPYRLLEPVGEGGMGAVFEAVRDDDEYSKRVAVKLLHRTFLSRSQLARFRRERQILADLEHPHIARLIDGGTTPRGLPYIVLELVEGEPIDTFCDRRRWTIPERLRLFEKLCGAVQYLHRNLVIHRDLKPSNVLVTKDGAPKLLDFGIAKLLASDRASVAQTVTEARQRVLTPQYSSPEQLEGGSLSTATDVFSLGVVLYKLLTGRLPFSDRQRSGKETPPPPALSATVADPPARDAGASSPAQVAAARGVSAGRLRRQLRGDLEAIVAKALRHEARERYASVEQLAEDLERHHRGLPVRARQGSLRYRWKSFLRRNRVAAAFVALVTISAAALGVLSFQLAEERDEALAQGRRAEEVTSFLQELFIASDAFNESSLAGSQEMQRDLTARELLDRGAERIRRELDDQPELRFSLTALISYIYLGLDELEKSEALMRRALESGAAIFGEDHPEVADVEVRLARLLTVKGELGQAEALARGGLEKLQRRLGDEHRSTAEALTTLAEVLRIQARYEEAEGLHRRALEIRRALFDEGHADVADSLLCLATVSEEKGDLERAEELFREALKTVQRIHGLRHPQAARTLTQIASVLMVQGRFEESEQILRQALEVQMETLPPGHLDIALTANNLASTLMSRGDLAAAEELFQKAAAITEASLGGDHDWMAAIHYSLANVRRFGGDPEGAEEHYRKGLKIARSSFGDEHPLVASGLHYLGSLMFEADRFPEADEYLEEAVSVRRRTLQEDHPQIINTLLDLAAAKLSRGDESAGDALIREARELRSRVPPLRPDQTAKTLDRLASALERRGRRAEAEELLAEALATLPEEAGETAGLLRERLETLRD